MRHQIYARSLAVALSAVVVLASCTIQSDEFVADESTSVETVPAILDRVADEDSAPPTVAGLATAVVPAPSDTDSTEAGAETSLPSQTQGTGAENLRPAQTATAAPEATATAEPAATAEPDATAVPAATAVPTATSAPTETADAATATPQPAATATAEPTATREPTATAEPTAESTATPVAPTATPVPTSTPVPVTATPVPTATPIPATATPVPTSTPVPSPTPNTVPVGLGAEVYAAHCAGCHGLSGQGVANFPALTNASSLSQAAVVTLVTGGGTVMPGFSAGLTVDQIDAVATYARSQF